MSQSLSPATPAATEQPPFAVPVSATHRFHRRGKYQEHFSIQLATPAGPITLDTLPQTLSTHRKFSAFVLSRLGLAMSPVRPGEWAGVLARILERGRAVTSA